jgi:hypothetical protein
MISTEEARSWLRQDLPRICAFLGIRAPKVSISPWRKKTAFIRPREIHLGILEVQSRGEFRLLLIHACLHAAGIPHDRTTKALGFKRVVIEDALTRKLSNWIFNDGAKPAELDFLMDRYASTLRV